MQTEKMSFRKRLENFWYYYKIHTFVAIFLLIVIGITVSQCATKVDPDVTIMVATSDPVLSQDSQDSLQSYLQSLTADVNKDGKKSAQCDVLYFSDAQTAEAMQAKLAVDLMSSSGIYIYITDDKEFQQLQQQKVFGKLSDYLPGVKGEDDYRVPLSQTALGAPKYNHVFDNLTIGVKAYKGTDADGKKYAANIRNSLDVLQKIVAGK